MFSTLCTPRTLFCTQTSKQLKTDTKQNCYNLNRLSSRNSRDAWLTKLNTPRNAAFNGGLISHLPNKGAKVSKRRIKCVAESNDVENLSSQVRWLPELDLVGGLTQTEEFFGVEREDLKPDPTKKVMPLFPLGVCYIPGTDQVLQIFEPRYRAMFNDILFNGSRRFVITMVSQVDGRFAEVGVVFYLKDLKEVSEQTGDQIKYICEHEVIGRVKINKVLNPEAWKSRETYLKVEVEDMVDADAEEDVSEVEAKLVELFQSVVYMQMSVGQEVRFSEAISDSLQVGRGDSDGLWKTITLWQDFSHQRLISIQQDAQKRIQAVLMPFVEDGKKTASGQFIVNFDKLPMNIRAELKKIQDEGNEDMKQLMGDPYLPFQIILQSDRHGERISMLTSMVEEEQRRLQARVALKSLFQNPNE